jgi:hypothetical protein
MTNTHHHDEDISPDSEGIVPTADGSAPHVPLSDVAVEIWCRDERDALAAHRRGHVVTLPGRSPIDLDTISDLTLD